MMQIGPCNLALIEDYFHMPIFSVIEFNIFVFVKHYTKFFTFPPVEHIKGISGKILQHYVGLQRRMHLLEDKIV